MAEVPKATDHQRCETGKFSLSSLIVFAVSIVLGLSFWWIVQDWYVGALAAVSFWIVLGLAAQVRDIWSSYPHCNTLTRDERWGLRFAFLWRIAVCCLIVFYFLGRLLVRFHVMDDGQNHIYYHSPHEIWDAVLLISIITAIAGSLGIGRKVWRCPWSWGIAIFRGFIAGFLFMMLLEHQLIVTCLAHITTIGILLYQPIQYSTDVAFFSSRTRVTQFYDIATAGAISLIVSCILLWQLSVRWRAAWRHRICLGTLLAVSMSIMVLLTVRIAVVEYPTISPLMAANYCSPTPLHLIAAVVLVMLIATAVARRWSEPRSAKVAPEIAVWRHDERRYYHERRVLIFLLSGIVLMKWFQLGYDMHKEWGLFGVNFRENMGYLLTFPKVCLSLALVLLTMHVVFFKKSNRTDALALEQPRLTPGIFVIVWFSMLTIVVGSAPIFASWHFASFMRSGYFPK